MADYTELAATVRAVIIERQQNKANSPLVDPDLQSTERMITHLLRLAVSSLKEEGKIKKDTDYDEQTLKLILVKFYTLTFGYSVPKPRRDELTKFRVRFNINTGDFVDQVVGGVTRDTLGWGNSGPGINRNKGASKTVRKLGR